MPGKRPGRGGGKKPLPAEKSRGPKQKVVLIKGREPKKKAALQVAFMQKEIRYGRGFNSLFDEIKFITGMYPREHVPKAGGPVPEGQMHVVNELAPMMRAELTRLEHLPGKRTPERKAKIARVKGTVKRLESRRIFYENRLVKISNDMVAAAKNYAPRRNNYRRSKFDAKTELASAKPEKAMELVTTHLHNIFKFDESAQVRLVHAMDSYKKASTAKKKAELKGTIAKHVKDRMELSREASSYKRLLKKYEAVQKQTGKQKKPMVTPRISMERKAPKRREILGAKEPRKRKT